MPNLKVGDLVVFERPTTRWAPPTNEGPRLRVKRVAAVEGQQVPRWLSDGLSAVHAAERVPWGFLVVRGDADRSQDSRQLGYISVGSVVAVVRNRRRSSHHHE
jgi:signal peptidase I